MSDHVTITDDNGVRWLWDKVECWLDLDYKEYGERREQGSGYPAYTVEDVVSVLVDGGFIEERETVIKQVAQNYYPVIHFHHVDKDGALPETYHLSLKASTFGSKQDARDYARGFVKSRGITNPVAFIDVKES